MASIQALYQMMQEKDRKIDQLRARVTRLEQQKKKRTGRKYSHRHAKR
jgi:hypothetical protein